MDFFTLPIFPEHTVAVSLTTTVWVGVCVVAFCNLRLGWPLTGLVVPGYLAPLIIAKPMSVSVILVEAVITYAIVWWLSESMNRLPNWSSFFGRDRFFAIVIVSVLVRCTMDGWLLPWLGPKINELGSWNIDYRNHLHSYGLIIVALVANCFWKPGLLRGGTQLLVSVGATFLIVRYALIECTNFNVGSLQYIYEDVASSLLASPKAYIILLTTAFVASWLNLRYAWDYNGILIPALLALQLHDPIKIVVTFFEALVVLCLAIAILKLPIWRRTTMTGARRTMFFFTLTFIYRLSLGHVVPQLFPQLNVTDVFGFGYLLSTLLAIRAHDSNVAIRVARASVQVSLVGAVAGSFIGFALSFVPDGLLLATANLSNSDSAGVRELDIALIEAVRRDKLLIYQMRTPNSFVPPTAGELETFSDGLRRLQKYREFGDERLLREAAERLSQVNYAIHRVEDKYLYLREKTPPRGWGIYALNVAPNRHDARDATGPLIEVPAPLDEWSTIESGLCLFHRLDGDALAIAGAGRHTNEDGSADVLTQGRSTYLRFHRVFSDNNVVEVRGVTLSSARQLPESAKTKSSVWIKGSIPRGVSLSDLEKLGLTEEVHWRTAPTTDVVRESTWSGFLELYLTRARRRKLIANLAAISAGETTRKMVSRRNTPIGDWLHGRKDTIAARQTESFALARQEELLFFDEQVLSPLLRIASATDSTADLGADDREELDAIASAAAILDYELLLFENDRAGREYFALCERAKERPRNWGVFVFRVGFGDPYLVEVPRPLFERHAFEFGIALFDRLPASGLLIAGAHPHANADGSADVTRTSNKVSLYNLVHQVVLREMNERNLLVAQARAMRAPAEADVTIATAVGARERAELSRLQTRLLQTFEEDGLSVKLVDGSPESAGYEAHGTVQVAAASQTERKEFVSLWLSPTLRSAYQQQSENDLLGEQFRAIGIPTLQASLSDYLRGYEESADQLLVADRLREDLWRFAEHQDIVTLRRIQTEWSDRQFLRLIDTNSRQAFLLIATPVDEQGEGKQIPAIFNLRARPNGAAIQRVSPPLTSEQVRRFIETRATWLEVRP